jgi:acetyl/propionyl-CoA carboxylase alpha subunit
LKKENRTGLKPREFHRILIANRGEIALRITRAIRELDKLAVVIHSDGDKNLPFVTEADEAYSLGSGELSQTYLNVEKIIRIARESHVDAIHPGYGFLAENADFARACQAHGIVFIGPSPEVISLMGHKSNARSKALELGLPVLEGMVDSLEGLISKQQTLPYPVLIKPAAGGGGKGMRIVRRPELFEEEARHAAREAGKYFGSDALYVESYLDAPRHIEVQVIADHHGNSAHLHARECSIQRRYQKIIEEAPPASLTESSSRKISSTALDLIRGIDYTNAGTVEFLMDQDQNFFFLEMNTRIQVEHPVTEMISGIDLVKEQITVAEGHPLSFTQDEVVVCGHALEARLYAENTEKDFLPSTGRIDSLELPSGNGIRVDSGYQRGNLVEPWYDPMLAKIIVHGKNREEARKQLIKALKEVRISGLSSNRDFLVGLLRSDFFRENRIHTKLIDQEREVLQAQLQEQRNMHELESLLAAATLIALHRTESRETPDVSPWHRIGHWRILPEISLKTEQEVVNIQYKVQKGNERLWLRIRDKDMHVSLERRTGFHYWIRINEQVIKVWGLTDRSEILIDLDGHLFKFRRMDILDRRYIRQDETKKSKNKDIVSAPLNGRIVQINVKAGDTVKEGDPLLVIESMKMENKILSDFPATIKNVEAAVGQQVQTNQILLTLASL